ncbi:MAG: hypothetical protein EBZ36_03210 [Acidobacteria bacterium]|nr:hypothetical protein [Acidobacteriota bacterium]
MARFKGTNSLRSEFEFTESAGLTDPAVSVRLSPGIGQPVFRFVRATAVTPTPAQLVDYAGSYRSKALETSYQLEVREGKIFVQIRAASPFSLVPTVRDGFSGGGRNLIFNRDERGAISGFVLSDPTGRLRGVKFEREQIKK